MTRLRTDERGFALTELLVALIIGTIVLLGAHTLSTAVMHAQTRISDRSEAVARGRVTMEQISQQLRSQVCLGPGLPAISYGDSNQITFYADMANTTFVPQKRDLTFASGAITQRDYNGTVATSGTIPYTFTATPSRTRVIADKLVLQTDKNGATIPFFTYFTFDAGNPVRPAQKLNVPLSAADAARVVQISVNFGALASRGGSSASLAGEPFTANIFVRTADPTDPDHSPLCI
jgi:prepilin-type N-terminal cleavage/methylation domain-containing protein